jgi:hypothetical protein
MGEGGYQSEGEGRKDDHPRSAAWQEAVTQYCSKQYDTPTGHAYPNGVAYFLHELQGQAEQAGDRATATHLAALNDTYGLIAFPFLSFDTQSHYRQAFAKRGWLQQQGAEEPGAIELSDAQYRSLTQLLDKANISEMYKLTQRGEILHQLGREGKHMIPVAPILADLRHREASFRFIVKAANKTEEERKEEEAIAKKYPAVGGMRLIKPVGRVIRGGFSPDSNREKR